MDHLALYTRHSQEHCSHKDLQALACAMLQTGHILSFGVQSVACVCSCKLLSAEDEVRSLVSLAYYAFKPCLNGREKDHPGIPVRAR